VAESALAKKLQISRVPRACARCAGRLPDELAPLPDGAEVTQRAHGHFDVVQAFVRTKADVDKRAAVVVKSAKPGGVIWLCWPKQSSHVETELNRDVLFEHAQRHGLRAVSNVSIDETWSALRFKPHG
jgi:hypothetical protein